MQFPLDILERCWFLGGPTASGKTETGLELAAALGAEIVALDSMSLYRGMDIGTAKPSLEACRRVPHHLLDVLEPHEEFDLADYVQAAHTVCKEILSRGHVPLFVGGTGLYLRSILRGVFEGPTADWDYRCRLEREFLDQDRGALHRRLQQVDPEQAAWIHPHDNRRIVRALEVYHLTGRPLSQQQQQQPLPIAQRPQYVYWLTPPREWLYERINIRVRKMIAAGLEQEVRSLLTAEQSMSRTARQALGYKEMIEHIAGGHTLEETIQLIQTRTRQFAKRQHTWFRNLEECEAIEVLGGESAADIAMKVLHRGKEKRTAARADSPGRTVSETEM